MSEKAKQILSYIFGWIGGLIVLFAIKENERNTKFHAAQAIVLSAGYMVISWIYGLLPLYIPFLSTALWIVYVGGIIWGIVKAAQEDKNVELPLIGKATMAIFGKKIDEVAKTEENK
ncbi:MAG: DUF4870 domain-containing protein [Clostridia bacterium]|nr:DUF4870 domain-containing protein [Clostridia bacterium]